MPTRTRSLTVAAIIAIAFGLLTLVSGGRALFGGADMGAVVPFVLWFNFLAGFAYVAAGLGFWFRTDWATVLSIAIALATAVVFAAFLWNVSKGVAFEARTVGAMGLRLVVWVIISIVAIATGKARQR
ncbi:MAG: hypothetical protein C0427_15585 [Rhodobacter sp.]|jgi:hypothetical protein|nr:hypothetical protein [Rhodobacter sp.]